LITGVVLAAGSSSRFGRTKQLERYHGAPLVQYPVDALEEAGVDEIVVVLGHDAGAVREALRLPTNARIVENVDHAHGQATSLIAALRAADARSDGAVVLLADQPGITAQHVRVLIGAFEERTSTIVRLRFRDGPGPALLGRDAWQAAMQLEGDLGARELIDANAGAVREVLIDEGRPPDIDTPEDLLGLE
jgi:molybdenum cofactor cytidylyltransferase